MSAFTLLFGGALLAFAIRPLWLTKLFALATLAAAAYYAPASPPLAGFGADALSLFFGRLLLLAVAAAILSETERINIVQTLFIGAASFLLLQSTTLLTFIFAFEALSIISFVLVARIQNASQAEGAVKMFVAGALATGFIMLGLALFTLDGHALNAPLKGTIGMLESIALWIILAGLFYKLTIVPMHSWAADSYALVRPAHAAVISGIAKTAVVVALFKLFAPWFAGSEVSITILLTLAVVTMSLGNILALFQQRLGRILAYSSIAHAGYMLMAVAAVQSAQAPTGVLYLAIAYLFMQTAAFLLLDRIGNGASDLTLDDIRGLASRDAASAFYLSVQLFSLAGIPLLAGFLGKAVAVYAVVDAGYWPVALAALLNSALSVGYYAWIVKGLYFDAAASESRLIPLKAAPKSAQLILLAGTLYFGVAAYSVFTLAF